MFKEVSASIIRPNNTTPYAAGDVIGTASNQILTFNNVPALDQNHATLLDARVLSNEAPATLPSLELWVFKVAPAAAADNTAWAVTDAELLNLVGIYPMANTYVGLASGNHVQLAAPRAFPFNFPSGVNTLYGVLVVRNAYTPVALESYTAILGLAG